MSAKGEKVRPLHAGVMLKSGKPVEKASLDELTRVIVRHSPGQPDHNPGGRTLSAAVIAAGPLVEAREEAKAARRQKATEENKRIGDLLAQKIRAELAKCPRETTHNIAKLVRDQMKGEREYKLKYVRVRVREIKREEKRGKSV